MPDSPGHRLEFRLQRDRRRFFILLAFRLFLAYIDTGQRKYWIWQWVVFLLGFGVLELNVVYPALAAGYALVLRAPAFSKDAAICSFHPSCSRWSTSAFIPHAHGRSLQDAPRRRHIHDALELLGVRARRVAARSRADWRPFGSGSRSPLLITASAGRFRLPQDCARGDWLPLFLVGWFVMVLAAGSCRSRITSPNTT